MAENTETDRLIREKGKNTSDSSTDELDVTSLPTGTFSSGVDLSFLDGSTLLLVQTKRGIPNLTQKAKEYLKGKINKKQLKQALELLEAIENLVKGYDDLDLSGISMSIAEDGSLAISWRVETALFGTAIRPKITESSWFLVQGDVEKGYKADGYLDELDYETQLPYLVQMLIKTQIRQKA
ncbi:MAG: hypothetical protein U0V48_11285 [Anaerolineales bacterium]